MRLSRPQFALLSRKFSSHYRPTLILSANIAAATNPLIRSTTSPDSSLINVTGIDVISYSSTISGLSVISIAVYGVPVSINPCSNISHIGHGGDERLIIVNDFVITSVLPFRLNILRRLSNRPTCAALRYLSHYLRHRASKSASLLGQYPLYLAPLNRRLQASRPRHVS